ncbi:sensor histidine kinase [Geodermatophilus marinus]|uniref:sensor histidine kinase n=1 Tax=Geodermatophilus sp. LHW52908 TaxID=2303986 RepID=UPI001314FF9A|nr:sensor histidine kinase [Geodermatophilus sp. LHW52908]
MDQAVDAHTTPPARPGPDPGAAAPGGFRHAVGFVGSDREIVATALPYVEAGLRAGDRVALTSPAEVTHLLCTALGDRAASVVADEALSLLGARAPDAVGRARELAAAAAGRGSGRLRILSFVDVGDRPAGRREGLRFEAACNRLMAGSGLSVLCLYDRRRLPADVLAGAAVTHPEVLRAGAWTASADYQEPERFIAALSAAHDPLQDRPPVLAVDDAATLPDLRHRLGAALDRHVPDADQREDLHLGVSEVAANAFRHGRRPVSARLWVGDGELVCTVTDAGTSFGDPLAGFRPAHGDDLARGGMGLWLARKLFDTVDLLPSPAGLTVRLAAAVRGTT